MSVPIEALYPSVSQRGFAFGSDRDPSSKRGHCEPMHLFRHCGCAPPDWRQQSLYSQVEAVGLSARGKTNMKIIGAIAASVLVVALALMAAVPASAQGTGLVCRAGTKIEIDWYGKWLPGVIKDGADTSGECLVSYDGYTSAWDARIPPRKLRLPGHVTALAALPAINDELWPGNYVCTGVGARLSPAFGFTIRPGKRVTDHEGGNPGSYKIDTKVRTITFKGGGWDGRTGRFGLAENVFTHYQGEREIVTCRPINASKPKR